MPVDVSQVSQLKQQLEGKTKELSTSKARISELENELKTVEGLKTQLADKTQELSTSEGRVFELEKKLREAQMANVKTVQGLKNQLDQKTKEMSTSKGRISDVEKGLNEALAASQANIKIAEEAQTASQKLEGKVKDLISQVSGLKSALAVVDEGDQPVTEEEDLDPRVRCLQDQVHKLTTSCSQLHANVEHCVAFLNDYTGYRLAMDSWIKVLRLAVSPIEGDVYRYDGVAEFWRVQDTWGNGRSTYSQSSAGTLHSCLSLYAVLMSRPDGMDWMNLALLHASNLLADMINDRQKIYRGLLVEITNTVVRMVKEHIIHQNDPLLLSVWQVLTYANEMTQKSLAVTIVSLVEVLGGQLTNLATAITSGPSDVQALCEQEESGIYYSISQVGVLLDRDMGTNERWYIVLNFAAKTLRVVVGKRWEFVDGPSVQFTGNDENTTYTFEIDGGGLWWISSK